MLWNLLMHVLMGGLGAYFFTLSPEGIGMAVLVVCVTQAVDQIRLRKELRSKIESAPGSKQKEAGINRDLALLFVQNVALYSVVVVISAETARSQSWL